MKNRRTLPQRRKASRDLLGEIHVYVEGLITESSYLNQLKKLVRSNLFQVHVYPAQGVPLTLVSAAVAKAQDLRRRRKPQPHEVWAVFDIDQHPKVPEAIDKAKANGVEICVSDPCFELWLVFHFRDFDAPVDRHEIQKVLSGHCAEYAKSGKNFSMTSCGQSLPDQVLAVENAIKRAEIGLKRRAEEGGRNPSTTCHNLVKSLRRLNP